ncbi:MAG: hypothetical protein COA97_08500 [Flavobacteriales bacterium]|nr:MAG: hypothetical protein COA97_08500 [Flavobacteriales bacterium]
MENILRVQIYILVLSLVLGTLGILGYKKKFFEFANRKERLGNLIITLIFIFSTIFYIEFVLRIKPVLTTQELYDASIPYENAIFSRTKLPQNSQTIYYPYLKGKVSHQLNQGYRGPGFSYKKPKDEKTFSI